ncbi:MAG: SIS domain-containing protein [Tuberibacillus sp.]
MSYYGFSESQLELAGNTFTSKEIYQQPVLWEEALVSIEERKDEIKAFLSDKLSDKNTRVIFTGAGTSAYVGDTITPYLNKILPNRVESIATTDLVSNPLDYFEADTPTILVSFARSGNSPESIGAYQLAEQIVKDLNQVVITCNPEGELAKRAIAAQNSLMLLMPEGSNDQSFAMTSSFSCMYLTAISIFNLENFEVTKQKMKFVVSNANRILEKQYGDLQELVELDKKRVVYLGSSTLKGLSKETALKNLELASGQVPTFWESVLGFRHGPKSIVDDETLIFVFLSNDPYTRQYDLDLLKELKNDPGNKTVVAVTYYADPELAGASDKVLTVQDHNQPLLEDVFIALDYLLYGQIYAMLNSMHLGVSPDNPAPDGTVNRVVKGVQLYPLNF